MISFKIKYKLDTINMDNFSLYELKEETEESINLINIETGTTIRSQFVKEITQDLDIELIKDYYDKNYIETESTLSENTIRKQIKYRNPSVVDDVIIDNLIMINNDKVLTFCFLQQKIDDFDKIKEITLTTKEKLEYKQTLSDNSNKYTKIVGSPELLTSEEFGTNITETLDYNNDLVLYTKKYTEIEDNTNIYYEFNMTMKEIESEDEIIASPSNILNINFKIIRENNNESEEIQIKIEPKSHTKYSIEIKNDQNKPKIQQLKIKSINELIEKFLISSEKEIILIGRLIGEGFRKIKNRKHYVSTFKIPNIGKFKNLNPNTLVKEISKINSHKTLIKSYSKKALEKKQNEQKQNEFLKNPIGDLGKKKIKFKK
jgi:hypothetical protein